MLHKWPTTPPSTSRSETSLGSLPGHPTLVNFHNLCSSEAKRVTNALSSQALSRSEAGGTILRYTVTFEALHQQRPLAEVHLTNQTSYARVTPRVGYKITVTAENSKGRSPSASIVTNLGIQGKGFCWLWTTGNNASALLCATHCGSVQVPPPCAHQDPSP